MGSMWMLHNAATITVMFYDPKSASEGVALQLVTGIWFDDGWYDAGAAAHASTLSLMFSDGSIQTVRCRCCCCCGCGCGCCCCSCAFYLIGLVAFAIEQQQ